MVLAASLLSVSAVFADPMQALLELHARMEAADAGSSASTPGTSEQQKVLDALLSAPDQLADVAMISKQLHPVLRSNLEKTLRFQMLQEKRPELGVYLDRLGRPVGDRTPLSSDNMLKIPMRTGKLEISFMFVKKYGTIFRCDRERFQATLDTVTIDVVPDPNQAGRVIAKFGGTDPNGQPLPAEPIGGVIKSDGKTAEILGDDGTWAKVAFQGGEKFKISSNKLPVTVNAKYID